MIRKIIFTFLPVCLVVFGLPVKGQFEAGREVVILVPLAGAAIVPGAVSSTVYVKNVSGREVERKISNIITLQFGEQSKIYCRSGFTAAVRVKIESWAVSDPLSAGVQTQTQTLSVHYDTAAGAAYTARAYVLLPVAEQVKITVEALSITGAGGWDPTPLLVLENEMRILRYYQLAGEVSLLAPLSLTAVDDTDGLQVSWAWNGLTGNNMSQLEWAWVPDELAGYYTESGLLFQSNSSRVDLEAGQTSYKIPLLYGEAGKLYYRLRAALRKNDGSLISGAWPAAKAFSFAGHQSNLNWQSSTSFAENGKYKTVIEYFDGSLRSRQSVTKDNSTGNILVAETFYDLQGRPNVQLLPTPIAAATIKYHRDFNRFNVPGQVNSLINSDDPARYFDLSLPGLQCNPAPALDTAYGNGRYYSGNNPWLATEQKSKYIPAAQGYAYAETRYTDDATQRVSRQGGVGQAFQINGGHDRRYFYGKPAQQELDALFGTEVGDASHYSKNMVQDANGQMSVSYSDMHGRTVATALAGDSTPNLQAIYTNTAYYPASAGQYLTNHLLTPATNIIKGNSLEAVSTILVPATTDYRFTYSLAPPVLNLLNCSGRQICFDCKYDLEISLRPEDCTTTPALVRKYNNLQIVPCGTSLGFTGPGLDVATKEIVFNQTLTAGAWIVRKTLTLNDSLYALRKDSVKELLCSPEQKLYDSVYQVAASGCNTTGFATTRPCDSCQASLGAFSAYRSRYLQAIGVSAGNTQQDVALYRQYTLDSLACAGACGALDVRFTTLTSLRYQLLNDMVPYTGQYARAKDSLKNAAGLYDPARLEVRFNIFTDSYTAGGVVMPKAAYFRYPKNEAGLTTAYYTDDDQPDLTLQPAGAGDRALLSTIAAKDYVNLFQRPWAKSLLFYHPEFGDLQFAETRLATSYAWLDKMQACTTYAAAVAGGYVAPLASDPYFVNNYAAADKALMAQYLTANLGQGTETFKPSLWQLANGTVACATVGETDKGSCIAAAKKDGPDPALPKDLLWQRFKSIYLSYRNEMVVKYIQANARGLSPGGRDSLKKENKLLAFATPADVAAENGWSWWPLATAANIDTAALRLAAAGTGPLTTDKCSGQKPFWKARLLQCEALLQRLGKHTAADTAVVNNLISAILDGLVLVCRNSASPQQPYGHSTLNPASGGTPVSFESVINNVLQQNGISTTPEANYFCNPYTIDFPRPFGKNPPLLVNLTSVIDTCACKRFAALKREARAALFDTLSLSGPNGMNRFLLTTYQDSLTPALWQGLQKCGASLFKDTCYQVIGGPGFPYDPRNQRPAFIPPPGIGVPCPMPSLSAAYVNTTTAINNVRVSYSTALTSTGCFLTIYDGPGNYLDDIPVICGTGKSVTISLAKCRKYRFSLTARTSLCTQTSPLSTLEAVCIATCPGTAVISGVSYLNTGPVNNVQVSYSSSAAATNCQIVVTNFISRARFVQSIAAGSASAVLSLPACQTYSFQLFSGTPANCYDSSNVFILPGCTSVCNKIYRPVILPDYVSVPPLLACDYQKPCLSCPALTALVAEFKALFPGYTVPYTESAATSAKELQQNSLLARFLNYRTGFTKRIEDYVQAIRSCGSNGGSADALCSFSKPPGDLTGIFTPDTLCRAAQTQAAFITQVIWQQRKDSLLANFDSLYKATCLAVKYSEQFYAACQPKEYHYTLYYYDQAGNLVKTLPPAAVKPDYSPAYLAQVAVARAAAGDLTNNSNNALLGTQYRYNSLNQVSIQKTPDAGISQFWYDQLGRLVVSRNAKQLAGEGRVVYSYTLYDALGRITEVGQQPQNIAMTQSLSQDTTALKKWLNGGGPQEQVTATRYDQAYTPLAVSTPAGSGLWQRNLRNRVSYTYVKALAGNDADYPWDAATFYSYDIHGNVDTLLQDYKTGMGSVSCSGNPGGNRFKKIVYAYDLISGKVNEVAYQPGQADGFYHRYNYDAENKLTEVKTSRDKIYWEREALYAYYRHGPLARTVLGQNQVQGLDYAYTLQGWLKGVNATRGSSGSLGSGNDCGSATAVDHLLVQQRLSPFEDYTARRSITFENGFVSKDSDNFETFLNPALGACSTTTGTAGSNSDGGPGLHDMGQDGLVGAGGSFVNTGTNLQTSDAYGFSLNYFNGDYQPVNNTVTPFAALSMPLPADAGGVAGQLFNGNIAAMAVNIPRLGTGILYGYGYDQLNRLVRLDAFSGRVTGANTFAPVRMNEYHEAITYDPNGNIQTYLRNGDSRSLAMDKLSYYYTANTNQLQQVADAVVTPTPADYHDIKSQAPGNYTYDKIGNLTSDKSEGLTNISWTLYNKIKSITKTGGTTISYTYDAGGNRISKIVTTPTTGDSTYYVRDASGNVMSVYNKKGALPLTQTELHLYGSSRLGIYNVQVDVQNCSHGKSAITTFSRGNKFFELSNHLGNVLATVSDKRLAVSLDGIFNNYYLADVVTASDYAPFGSLMVGRQYTLVSSKYRYGFNGKENDAEVKGEGNQQDYGMRIYDPRLGKFLSVDPITKDYPELTPYQFASNTPIWAIDLDGLEGFISMPDERTGKQNTIAAEQIKKFVVERHEQGMNNVRAAEEARAMAIKQGRVNGDGITAWIKIGVYFGAWWFGGGINSTVNPVQNAKDAKQDLQDGHYIMGSIGLLSIIPGLGEMKALKSLSAESKALIKTVGKFEHASREVAIATKSGILEDALHIAKDLTGAVPEGAVEIFGKQGVLKGKAVGYQWRTEDGIFKRIRLDNDLKVGSHINITVGKKDFSILINGGENQATQISTNEIMKTVLKK